MTPKQKALLKEQKLRRKERERLRKEKRKARKEARMGPKRALAKWSREGLNEGKCSVCGVGVVTKLNPDGTPKLNKRGKPILIHLHAHHILAYQYWPEFRTEPKNRLVLCVHCHKFGPKAAHTNPVFFALWLRDNKPLQYAWVAKVLGFDPFPSNNKEAVC